MADDLESRFWGNCCNTFVEETKQFMYMRLMGFELKPIWRTTHSFDMGGKSVIDIGGGPCSILLKCENRGRSLVVDPAVWPEWVNARYTATGIETFQGPGEALLDAHFYPIETSDFDLALIYNCLQHVDDPEKIVANACAAAKELRMFEWINIPPHEGHPHELKADLLEKWTGRQGRVVDLPECGGVAWVLGPPPQPPAPGARKSRIVLGGA